LTQGRKIRENHKILQIADCSLQLANDHDSVINLTVYDACPSTKMPQLARMPKQKDVKFWCPLSALVICPLFGDLADHPRLDKEPLHALL
jgi:hypothetical protein